MPDLESIVHGTRVPIKLSCIVSEQNAQQLNEFAARCGDLGVRRLVFRQVYGSENRIRVQSILEADPAFHRQGSDRGNPVYTYGKVKVTCWDFMQSRCRSLSLFSDGTISDRYLLEQAVKEKGNGPENLRHFHASGAHTRNKMCYHETKMRTEDRCVYPSTGDFRPQTTCVAECADNVEP
jgi:hypothetical protein